MLFKFQIPSTAICVFIYHIPPYLFNELILKMSLK